MKATFPSRSSRGFSMIELLVVITIMVILAAAVVPALRTTNQAAQLSSAGQGIADELKMASQMSRTYNAPVQVRFYLLPDPTSSSTKVYRAYQSFLLKNMTTTVTSSTTFSSSNSEPLTKVNYLPTGVIIYNPSSSSYSTLITDSSILTSTTSLPAVGTATFSYFLFKPDGSANLLLTPKDNTNATWCLTVQSSRATQLDSNYATIQLDPAVSTVKLLRP